MQPVHASHALQPPMRSPTKRGAHVASQFTCTHHRATRQTNTACVHVHQWQRSHKSRTAKGARAGLGLLVALCTLGGTSWQHAGLRRPCKGEQAHSRDGRSLFSRALRRSLGRRCQVPGIHRQTLGCRRERAAHHLHLHARGGGGVEVVSLICRLCARSHADLGAHLATRGEWARVSLHICS
jgi:hypothetical protein